MHHKYFDFPRATTPAPPLPERTHPKHARAQSLGQQISTKTNTTSQTARRTKSTFTSPKHQAAIVPTHVEKSTSTAPSTAFTLSSTTSTTTVPSTANTSIPLISPPLASSSAPNSPHSRNRKTKRNASISGNSKSISSITSPSGRVRLAITPRGEPKQIIHPLHVAPSYSQPILPTPITIPQTTSTPITIPQTASTPVTPRSTLAAPHPWQTELSQSHTPNSHSSIAPSTPEPFFSNFQPPEPTPLNAPTTNNPSTQSNHQITPFDDPS